MDHIVQHRLHGALARVAPAVGFRDQDLAVVTQLHNPPILVRCENPVSKFGQDHVADELLNSIQRVQGDFSIVTIIHLDVAVQHQIKTYTVR